MYKIALILVAFSPLFVSVNAGELYTSESGNTFYMENKKTFTWYEAINMCASRNMRLLTPDTEKKNLEITKLVSAVNSSAIIPWTSGQETDNLKFVWTTTGNKVTYTKWNANEPVRRGSITQCIYIYEGNWYSSNCISTSHLICEENPIVKESIRDLYLLKTQQSVELNKMKSHYENEIIIKLEELKQSCRNETQELTKVNLEELHALKNVIKSSYENETNSKLEELKKLHDNDRNNLLEEKQRDLSVLKTDCEKQLNQLTLANKIQEIEIEIEMLKTFRAKELRVQEEKHNYCENETNSNLAELKKLHENDKNHLLHEKQREMSVLKTDFEKQLNKLTSANKMQEIEIEMLKTFHAKELRLQDEKQNFALNSLKSPYDILNNRTSANKSYNILFNVHGNRN